MTPSDHSFTVLMALLAIAVGLFSGVLWRTGGRTAEERIRIGRSEREVAAGPLPEYASLAGQTPERLAAQERLRRRELLIASHAPRVDLLRWKGVLVVDASAEEVDAAVLLASFAESPDHEEGPPFHFLAAQDGSVDATERWERQRPWRTDGLPASESWIVVVSLAGWPAAGEVDLLIEGLRTNEVSHGALAVKEGFDGPPRIVER